MMGYSTEEISRRTADQSVLRDRSYFSTEKDCVSGVSGVLVGGTGSVVPQSAFVDVHCTFDATRALAHRVIDMVSRLIGPPEASDAGKIEGIAPEPSAMFNILRDDSRRTAGCVRDAQEALDRLERALP